MQKEEINDRIAKYLTQPNAKGKYSASRSEEVRQSYKKDRIELNNVKPRKSVIDLFDALFKK